MALFQTSLCGVGKPCVKIIPMRTACGNNTVTQFPRDAVVPRLGYLLFLAG